jgi:hypothetical protein
VRPYNPQPCLKLPLTLRLSRRCVEQTNAVLLALHRIAEKAQGGATVRGAVDAFVADFERGGLGETLGGGLDGKLAAPRTFEIAGALNRLRLAGLISG